MLSPVVLGASRMSDNKEFITIIFTISRYAPRRRAAFTRCRVVEGIIPRQINRVSHVIAQFDSADITK